MADQCCIICCLSYNVTTRRPFDLGCGHCVCEQCFNTSKFNICMECRQPTNNPHLQYTLLRMLQPSSPTSFPIGCVLDDADEAPGTPHPSAPIMEVEPWEQDDSGSDLSSHRTSSSFNNTSAGSTASRDRLAHQPYPQSTDATASRPAAVASAVAQPDSSTALALHRNSIPVHALTLTSTWTTTNTVSVGLASAGPTARTTAATAAGVCVTSGRSSSLQDRQLVSHQLLTSFPVEDFDLDGLDSLSNSSAEGGLDGGDSVEEGAAAGANERTGLPPSRVPLAAVQAAVGGCMGLVQQLMVPHMLFDQGNSNRPGWPAPGPSLLLAITRSCWRTWAAYSTAVAHTLGQCQQLQLSFVARLGQLLARFGLPHAGQLAAYCLATWALGLLMYHWQLGLGLLPVAVAGLAFMAFGVMPSSNGGCCLWPAKLAGAVLAGDCLVLGLLGIAWQQLEAGAGDGHCMGMYLQLLSATPQALLLAVLLLWGQVAMEVISQRWATYRELSFASLVVRCWTVAAAAVIVPGPAAAALAAAVPWVQKAHLLLQAPVVVHHIGMLRPASTCWMPLLQQQQQQERQQQGDSSCNHASSSRAAAAAARTANRSPSRADSVTDSYTAQTGSISGSGSMSAWLLCVHCLLQLLLLLFVPPAPLAAVPWLPVLLRSGLVWSARVLLCGCLVQLVLQYVQPVGAGSQLGQLQAEVQPQGTAASRAGGTRAATAASGCGSSAAADVCCWASRCPSRDGCGGSGSSNSNNLLLGAGSPTAPSSYQWDVQLHGCNSHALAPASYADHSSRALCSGGLSPYGSSSSMDALSGALSVVKQHAAYLTLLLLAAAGDSFIMAVPSAAGTVRVAWHMCVQQMLAVMFVCELGG